tara:strand:+ start:367 stop:483 length:117 start_codon:yes stop_codon:yes gene_type:complete
MELEEQESSNKPAEPVRNVKKIKTCQYITQQTAKEEAA